MLFSPCFIKKMAIAEQNNLNRSSFLYTNFQTACLIILFIGVESLQPPLDLKSSYAHDYTYTVKTSSWHA